MAQSGELDSLWRIYSDKSQTDLNRVKAIDDYAWSFTHNNPDTAIILANEELQFAVGTKQKLYEAKALNTIGVSFMNKGEYPKALENYFKTLKIYEEIGDKNGIGSCNTNIGNIFMEMKNYSKAIEHFLKSLKLFEEIDNHIGTGACYTNIGIVYFNQKVFSKALENFEKALAIAKKIGDKGSEGKNNLNIANVYLSAADYAKSSEYFEEALKVFREANFKSGIEYCYGNMAGLYLKLGKYALAKQYADSSLLLSKETEHLKGELRAYEALASIYYQTGQYKEAFESHVTFKALTDSIFNIDNSKQLSDLKTQFEVEKKETELKTKAEAQEAINAEEKKRQKIVLMLVSFVLILVAVFFVLLYKRFRITDKQKRIIEIKSKETEEQKHLIEEKQKEIIDSITYAKRLQEAILPPAEFINDHLPDNFVLYKPKDLVAGDFYWAEKIGDLFFIAAADSTGHGVPGAMVSVVCSNALNRSVKEFNLTETGRILDKARELVVQTFEKSTNDVKDGMDISLLCIDKKNKQVFWSGANNPLWYFSSSLLVEQEERDESKKGGVMHEIKADKQPIGKAEQYKPFNTQQIEYQENTIFYLFTDGFADQFGGPHGKKFKYKQFSELLLSIKKDSLEVQRQKLNVALENWKGDLEQVDDICVIAIKI